MAKNTKPKSKHPGGRPSKKDNFPECLLRHLYTSGLTDKEVAELIGVAEQTINNWKLAYPKFFESLKDWKSQADERVERSLYERACGYEHPDTKPQWVETSELDPESGKIVKSGKWEYAEMIKHYPPDATSMIFWLKNRQPDKWRDKQDLDITDNRMIKAILEAMPAEVSDLVRQAIKDKAKK